MSLEASAPENAQEAPKDPSGDMNEDATATANRLEILEKENTRLFGLLDNLLAKFRSPEYSDDEDVQFDSEEEASAAACEITRLSSLEWRALEELGIPRTKYSLLTTGPRGRGDSQLRNQTIEVHPESDKIATEVSAEPTVASKSSDKKVYRLILNGRAELMEVLGGIFKTQALPGFYIWFWPFKYLISYEKDVRARLLEEECKFKDADKLPTSTVSPEPAYETGRIPNGDELQLGCEQEAGAPSADAQQIEEGDPASENQVLGDIHEAGGCARDTVVRFRSAELGNGREDYTGTNTTHKPSQANIDTTKTQNRIAIKNAPEPLHSIGGAKITDDRTRLRDELRCIVDFMDNDMKDIYSVQKDIDNGTKKVIAFDYLWQLFKPGDVVIEERAQKRAYIVLHVTGGRSLTRSAQRFKTRDEFFPREVVQEKAAYLAKYPKSTPFVLDCFYLDFDGTNFGPRPAKFMFKEYDGEKPIRSLEVFPARFDGSTKQTEKALIKRGKRFVKLAQVEHKYYSGSTIKESPAFEIQREVHGEIIIDFDLAIKDFFKSQRDKFFPIKWDLSFGSGVIANPTPADEREMVGYGHIVSNSSPQFKPTYLMEDATYDNELSADFTDNSPLLNEQPDSRALSKEALMLLPPRVYGFSLLDRTFHAFDLTKIEDIKSWSQGFEQLILPKEHKKIMQALVKNHTKGPAPISSDPRGRDEDFSMDIVRGKGKGLVILLHGVPGVGKTSTAECVAAQTKRPLFPVTCGDIGIHPVSVEQCLTGYFDMAHKWGCVLLLDEADVFLTKREKGGDLTRNAIVSVFLRVLEYYSGILILTTNRIGEFDEAFSSRVHIKLYYPKLRKQPTLQIWKINMKRIIDSDLEIDVDESQIMKFARQQWLDTANKQTQRWNGRQIRNAFQTAIALAKWDHQEAPSQDNQKPCLSARQFQAVANTSSHFDDYISKIHGTAPTSDVWEIIAARDLMRINESPRQPTSRSAMAAKAKGRRSSRVRAESPDEDDFDEDDDEDEMDADEMEEEMRKWLAKPGRRQVLKELLVQRPQRDKQLGQSEKVTPLVEGDDEYSLDDLDGED
ncbi:hypothetical protein BDR22DRAFT_895391 [Usnea florida]